MYMIYGIYIHMFFRACEMIDLGSYVTGFTNYNRKMQLKFKG